MDEENISQALIIGVTTFISVMVVSAIIAFYNSGVRIVQRVGAGNDFSIVSRNDIESTLLMSGTGNYIKGTEVINLINHYMSDTKVVIMIQNIKYIDDSGNISIMDMLTMNSEDIDTRTNSYNKMIKYIMDNQDFTIDESNVSDEDNSEKIIVIKGV